ncbi:HAD family hydrolase [Occultella kanbiaonis]|uniref:HAD family hydrolase n=1 Tax=Occultella kanbiaonis TaxID=2675754 RepID=UPI0012B86267|nr:HAD-IA family hydrolase [Occultella kanbiaonis]
MPHASSTGLGRLGLPPTILAVLFDLDGVLTQTSVLHRTAWKQTFDPILAAHGQSEFTEAEYAAHVDGRRRYDGVRAFLASRGIHPPEGTPADGPEAETVCGIGNRKNSEVGRRLAADGVATYPGSVAYLHAVRAAGLRTAVVTASANGADVLAAAGLSDLLEARVDGVIAARDNLPGKPAPDTFLAGARALGVAPAQAAVIEDAIAGVQAGRAGSFGYVVGVDRLDQAAELAANGADVVVSDLAELLEGAAS